MEKNFGKIGLFTGLTSFVLLIFGVRNLLGNTLEVKNYIAFAVFGLIVGVFAAAFLFYKLKIAFYIFMGALLLGFVMMFLSFSVDTDGFGELAGILDLFMISSFGFGVALFAELIVHLIRKNKSSN